MKNMDKKMTIGFIGLGRMGMNMVLHLLDKGRKQGRKQGRYQEDHQRQQGHHQVVVYNRHPDKVQKAAKSGAIPTYSLPELVRQLPKRKIIWLMLPAGKPIDDMVSKLVPLLKKGDVIIDGGNSWFQDSQKRYQQLKKKCIHFLDCGTSGGILGARYGACFMVGGDRPVFKQVEPLFQALSVPNGR